MIAVLASLLAVVLLVLAPVLFVEAAYRKDSKLGGPHLIKPSRSKPHD